MHPSYIGCSVSEDWLIFTNFKNWMIQQDWTGKQLDKDLLVKGNKQYSSETCFFVSSRINKLLNDNKDRRGELPQGVAKKGKRFQAYCKDNGVKVNLGFHNNPKEAHKIYCKYKYQLIKKIATNQSSDILKKALLSQAELFNKGNTV